MGWGKGGGVRGRQGRSLALNEDECDHYKGQKSEIFGVPSLLDLLNFFSSRVFLFFSIFLCNLVRKSPQNVEKTARFMGGEKSVESCQISGCHAFFSPRVKKRGAVSEDEDMGGRGHRG